MDMWLRLRLRPNLLTANFTYPQYIIRNALYIKGVKNERR